MVGGVGRRREPPAVSRYTLSRVTGVRSGKSASFSSGKRVRKPTGFTTAPDRQWAPRVSAFSRTAISTSPRLPPDSWSSFTSRASSMAPDSPAGPPPTKTTSMGTASASGGSGRIRRPIGSSGWKRAGTTGPDRAAPSLMSAGLAGSIRGQGSGPRGARVLGIEAHRLAQPPGGHAHGPERRGEDPDAEQDDAELGDEGGQQVQQEREQVV